MEQRKQSKFYHTKSFRSLVAVALAVILLSSSAVDKMTSLFATETEPVQEEVQAPVEVHEPEPKDEPESGPEPGPEPTPEEEPDAPPQSEPGEEPESEADNQAESAAGAENQLAAAIAAEGLAYVRVQNDVYSSARLRPAGLKGRVSGIALAVTYHEADAGTAAPAAVEVIFATETGLETGFASPAGVTLLGYDEAIKEIGEGGVLEYQSAAWPLSLAGFETANAEGGQAAPAQAKQTDAEEPAQDEQATEQATERNVTISSDMQKIMRRGDIFTLTATLYGFDDVAYTVQWQYDEGEGWKDFPGGNALTLRVVAGRNTLRYLWRVVVTPVS